MRICVLVKEVPDVSVPRRIDQGTGRLRREGETAMNPYDAHAVEAAVALRESGALPVDEVVAVTMGPPSALRVLLKAVSMGADRSVCLSDPALAGSDVNGTAVALAGVLRREQPGLVLLGQQSADGECYAMAAAVAEHLGLPAVSQVTRMEVVGGHLRCERQAEFGYDAVELPLPAVVSVGEGLNEPRYPSLKAIMGARAKPLVTLDSQEAGVPPDRVGHSRARALCGGFRPPDPREPGVLVEEADPEAAVAAIVAWLDERRLLA